MLRGRFGAASRQMCAHVVALATVQPVTMTPGSDSEGSRAKYEVGCHNLPDRAWRY